VAPAQEAQENVTQKGQFDQRDQSTQVSSWVAGEKRVHARVTCSDRVCEFESRSADKDRRGSSSLMHGNGQPEVYTGPSPVNECAGNSAVERAQCRSKSAYQSQWRAGLQDSRPEQ
jgi:hypothetical protein